MSEPTSRFDELRSSRPLDQAWFGGVCGGLARQTGWSPLIWRVLFVVATSVKLVGIPVYLALWLAMPVQPVERRAPGIDAATHAGMRSAVPQRRLVDAGMGLAVTVLGVGLLWFVEIMGWGLAGAYLVPGLLAAAGTGAVWWQADRVAPRGTTGGRRRLSHFLGAYWRTIVAVVVGMVLLVGAAWLLANAVAAPGTPWVLTLVGLCAAAIVLALLPWVVRARRQLAAARADERVAAARADMAAHLHDSVLQTLALIQRRADDPRAVAALARQQERELRAYLYGEPQLEATLAEALRAEAADVEAVHGVPIDVVSVGDAPMGPRVEALVRAAREAMVNAATHSGAPRVDVYAEADGDELAVYVRDRGVGFDLTTIDADRAGVRGSIVERMERAGGRAIVRTAPGEGTEVRMEMPA